MRCKKLAAAVSGQKYVSFDPKQLSRVSCILWCYFQSDFQPYFKTLVCGAPFSQNIYIQQLHDKGSTQLHNCNTLRPR